MLLSVLYVLDGILVGDGPEWFRWTALSLSAYLGSSVLFLHSMSCLFELLCLYARYLRILSQSAALNSDFVHVARDRH